MNQKTLVPNWFKGLIVASCLIIGYGATHPAQQVKSDSTAVESSARIENKELYEVMWIDKYPQLQTDQWKAYMYTKDNIGISFDAHSAFKLTLELFEFRADNSAITFHFPHDARKARCGYKIEKLKKPTKHFDTQLTVENDPQNGGQTHVYYTGPDFRSLETIPAEIRESISGFPQVQRSFRHSEN